VSRIRDVYPRFECLPSRIQGQKDSESGSKKFLSSRKYDPDCSSRIRILMFYPSGSATLSKTISWMSALGILVDYNGVKCGTAYPLLVDLAFIQSHAHKYDHLHKMLKIQGTRGQLYGRTRAVFTSCMTIFPEGQQWQS
jgi:hypothetical protein